MKTFIASAMLLASAVSAAPTLIEKRTDSDATILNYILTLEHLEAAFYAQGLKNYTQAQFQKAGFTNSRFYTDLEKIAEEEANHVTVLTEVIESTGSNATAACTYSFPATTAAQFMALAATLEGVGISAYLGSVADLASKEYLTAAASIMTVEARHSAWIRGAFSMSPYPQLYDTPLDFDQVFTLASQFITTCPSSNPAIPENGKRFPMMTIVNTGLITQGAEVTFKLPSTFTFPSGNLYVAFPLVTGPTFESATVNKTAKTVTCKVPSGDLTAAGTAYAILTANSTIVNDANTLAGPAIIPILVPA